MDLVQNRRYCRSRASALTCLLYVVRLKHAEVPYVHASSGGVITTELY